MFSFVIRTKNEEEKLDSVLNSIEQQIGVEKSEVIIVDSGSTDATLEIARKHKCTIIEIPPEDFSWGYALNVGIERTSGNIVVLISGHCILLDEMCLQKVEDIFAINSDIQAIYGRQSGESTVDPFEKLNNLKLYPSTDGLHRISEEPIYVQTISSACTFLRKSMWIIQKYDEKVQSCEDAKWANEIMEKGFCVAYCGEIGVIHSHPLKVDYLYRKSYWREFEMVKLRKENHSKIYYFLKFMIKHMVSDIIVWLQEAKQNDEKIGFGLIVKYVYIINRAQLSACFDVKKEERQLKYSELQLPKWLKNYENLLR